MSLAAEKMAWVKEIEGDFAFVDLFARYTEMVSLTIKEVVDTGNDEMAIHFTDGAILIIRDDGQSCCESRYMTCDDDLSGHEGGQLLYIDTAAAGMAALTDKDDKDGDDDEWGGTCHETQFVRVQTTRGHFTLCTHNEHNGYYGGFSLSLKLHR